MSTLAHAAPLVRTGSCRLQLHIDGTAYSVRRRPGTAKGAKHWHLKKLAGPRAGTVYVLTSHRGTIDCSCPDTFINKCVCKHIRALQACGLASRRLRPAVVAAAALVAGSAGEGVAHV